MVIAEDKLIVAGILDHRSKRPAEATLHSACFVEKDERVNISARNAERNRAGKSRLLRVSRAIELGGRPLWRRRNTNGKHANNQSCSLHLITHSFPPLSTPFPFHELKAAFDGALAARFR